jgi:hypothetical protein
VPEPTTLPRACHEEEEKNKKNIVNEIKVEKKTDD